MIEEWKEVPGYEGLYEISSYGRVRSVDRYDNRNCFRKGKVLSPGIKPDGYLTVALSCNGKCKTINVHRLVAQVFIENPDNLPEVNHKDEDKTNNSVDNLEWCSRKYNVNYGSRKDKVKDTKIKNGYWTGLSKEEYRKKYNQDRKEYRKKWYQDHKDKICDSKRKYYQENRDRICEQKRTYYLKKKEQIQNNV